MKYPVIISVIAVLVLHVKSQPSSLGHIKDPIKDALYLQSFLPTNETLQDCVYKPANATHLCRDPDLRFVLYNNGQKQVYDSNQTDWLGQSVWDPLKRDILLVHGYGGGDDTFPINVLRDAYIRSGSYNTWILDWGALGKVPCYGAAVNNMRAIARCAGEFMSSLKVAGLPADKLTCVGHSLGAHICGLIDRYIPFQMHRIVALDPARQMITYEIKLNLIDADTVHILHTNAGNYGEEKRGGLVDFFINGGKIQPYCENGDIDTQLCSHNSAICYMAESLFPNLQKTGESCLDAPDPYFPKIIGLPPVIMGQPTDLDTTGAYCVYDNYPPYCPRKAGDIGDVRCCVKPPLIES